MDNTEKTFAEDSQQNAVDVDEIRNQVRSEYENLIENFLNASNSPKLITLSGNSDHEKQIKEMATDLNNRINVAIRFVNDHQHLCKLQKLYPLGLEFTLRECYQNHLKFDSVSYFFERAIICNLNSLNAGIITMIESEQWILVEPVQEDIFQGKEGDPIFLCFTCDNDLVFLETILGKKDQLIYTMQKIELPYLFNEKKAVECENAISVKRMFAESEEVPNKLEEDNNDEEEFEQKYWENQLKIAMVEQNEIQKEHYVKPDTPTDETHTPPVSATELSEILCVSKATLSNKSRPLGKFFKSECEKQNTKTPRLRYEDLFNAIREPVRRSRQEGAEDLCINSIDDVKDLWM
jgi:hypothetical protein